MRYDQIQKRRKLNKKRGKMIDSFKDKVNRGVIMGIPFTSQSGGLNYFGVSKGFQLGHIKGEPK